MRKIAMIIDTKNWAFDNIAQNVKKYINDYKIDIIPGEYFEGNMIRLFLFCKDYDIIHFLWRGYLSLINTENMKYYANSIGITLEKFKDRYVKNKLVTFSVCDQLYLEENEEWRTKEILDNANKYFVTSKKLYDIYNEFEKKPERIIHDGVDLNLYKPQKLSRFEQSNRNLVIGWVGNSKFTDSEGDSDLKGVNSIIKPAIDILKEKNINVSLKLADRNIKKIEQKDMPDYYNSIDIYVCASKTEGTPLTILEAMAMGIPIISTDVGIVSEAFGKKQQNFIMKERNVECLVENIEKMYKNQKILSELSIENLTRIKEWDWKKISGDYQEFFYSIKSRENL